ncbi:YaeQ family protein [Agrococcus sp. ARC_14]|uniref:YaeQ family protein n=1 Tax=Agrococcus sp. ARC_14 TaxID=2919927 RepID=UPI001F06DAE2|nr:YaeQ family protein [Agrococcus sp. ARC_14]MCH1882298.1 YaeQ family protein [Agrococcus sp. ARC_14]
MASGATIHTFEVQLSDVDRGVYEQLTLKVAQHPSETVQFMTTRVLALCLEHEEGIAFGGGISGGDEPAVLVRDRTGALVAWIEVGAPDAERVHRGSMAAERTAVYTHRDPERVAARWSGKRIHRAEDVRLVWFDAGFVDAVAEAITRRTAMSVSVTEGELYLEVNGTTLSSSIHERRAG